MQSRKRTWQPGSLWPVFALLAVACVYPKRSTALSSATVNGESSLDVPANTFTLVVVAAEVPRRNRGNLAWDDSEGLPDPFARIYRDDELIYETPVAEDTLTPEWNATLPRNFFLSSTSRLRIEVWDRDTVGSDPIGTYRQVGLPSNAIAGESASAHVRLMLEGGAQITLDLQNPHAFRGVGILEYEVRGDSLLVTRVETHSPAGRADIRPGDHIIAIGGDTVSALGEARAASAISLASDRGTSLRVQRGSSTRVIELDRGFVWPTM